MYVLLVSPFFAAHLEYFRQSLPWLMSGVWLAREALQDTIGVCQIQP